MFESTRKPELSSKEQSVIYEEIEERDMGDPSTEELKKEIHEARRGPKKIRERKNKK